MSDPFVLGPRNHVELADGRFVGHVAEQAKARADLSDGVAWLCQQPPDKPLVLHFHGGLVSRDAARESAVGIQDKPGLGPLYSTAGGLPFFFIWRSDLWTVTTKNLDEIAQEKPFRRILKKAAQWVATKVADNAMGGKGATLDLQAAPPSVPEDPDELEKLLESYEADSQSPLLSDLSVLQEKQIQKDLENDPDLRTHSLEIANGLLPAGAPVTGSKGFGTRSSVSTLMSSSALDELRSDVSREGKGGPGAILFLARKTLGIVVRVVRRLSQGHGHGVYTTIVEEILRALYLDNVGQLAWGLMKKDTADSFDEDGGGAAFIAALEKNWQDGRRIVLVGHSTGAIYITHFLAHLAARPRFANVKPEVVFLAPAITFDLMHANLSLYRSYTKGVRVFALSDGLERGYWEVPVLYKGSLLYIVSGLFESEVDTPILGMERFWSGKKPYDSAVADAMGTYILAGQRVWSLTHDRAKDGCKSLARRHGGYADDDSCRASLAHIISKGL